MVDWATLIGLGLGSGLGLGYHAVGPVKERIFFFFEVESSKSPVRHDTRARPRPPPPAESWRGERGGARRANGAPSGGPHIELGRLRLKSLI